MLQLASCLFIPPFQPPKRRPPNTVSVLVHVCLPQARCVLGLPSRKGLIYAAGSPQLLPSRELPGILVCLAPCPNWWFGRWGTRPIWFSMAPPVVWLACFGNCGLRGPVVIRELAFLNSYIVMESWGFQRAIRFMRCAGLSRLETVRSELVRLACHENICCTYLLFPATDHGSFKLPAWKHATRHEAHRARVLFFSRGRFLPPSLGI